MMWNSLFGWLSLIITTVVCFVSFDSALMIQAPKIPTGPIRIASNERRRARGEKKLYRLFLCVLSPRNDHDSLAVDHFQNYHCAQQEQQQQEPEGEEEARSTTVVL